MRLSPILAAQKAEEWYFPGPKIREFHNSKAKIRALIGGRGTGKTTSIAVETLRHAKENAGAKIYILRKTQEGNEDTTQETFDLVFQRSGKAYLQTELSLFQKRNGGTEYRLPSRMAMQKYNEWEKAHPSATKADRKLWLATIGEHFCSFLKFAGVPSNQFRATRFRGYECSLLIFVEADQLEREDFELGSACIRWPGTDPATCDERGFIKESGIILDTNPPGHEHWIAKMDKQAEDEENQGIQFWHIPTEENSANLPDGYVENLKFTYRNNPPMYKRMVLGEYADAFTGTPVLHSFRPEVHAHPRIDFPLGWYLIRGWDFGTTHSVVWSAYYERNGVEYWWDLLEYFARGSDTDTQCKRVHEITDTAFPFWNNRDVVAGVRDYADVAGNQKKDTGSSMTILRTNGFFPGASRIKLKESIAIYNRLLQKRDPWGNPIYRIDEKACPKLFQASLGAYRYPEMKEPGYGSDEPVKGPLCDDADCLVDAARYAKIGCMRLLVADYQKAEPTVGKLAIKKSINPFKRYY